VNGSQFIHAMVMLNQASQSTDSPTCILQPNLRIAEIMLHLCTQLYYIVNINDIIRKESSMLNIVMNMRQLGMFKVS
jgi:hypothetical protein